MPLMPIATKTICAVTREQDSATAPVLSRRRRRARARKAPSPHARAAARALVVGSLVHRRACHICMGQRSVALFSSNSRGEKLLKHCLRIRFTGSRTKLHRGYCSPQSLTMTEHLPAKRFKHAPLIQCMWRATRAFQLQANVQPCYSSVDMSVFLHAAADAAGTWHRTLVAQVSLHSCAAIHRATKWYRLYASRPMDCMRPLQTRSSGRINPRMSSQAVTQPGCTHAAVPGASPARASAFAALR